MFVYISDLITFYKDWYIKRSVVRPNVVVHGIRRLDFTNLKCYTDICKIFLISAEFAKVWSVQRFL